VFLAAVPFAFLAFLLALLLREVPLRTSMGAAQPALAEGTELAESLGMSPPQQKAPAHESLAPDAVGPAGAAPGASRPGSQSTGG
jgi:hypothetical protein